MECKLYTGSDWDALTDIWLEASVRAHDFIPSSFWEASKQDMKEIYLPHSEVYIVEDKGKVLGFSAMVDDTLAALFVHPSHQGKGIGSLLLSELKKKYSHIQLNVYKKNHSAVQFYTQKSFKVISEGIDERTGEEEYTMALQ